MIRCIISNVFLQFLVIHQTLSNLEQAFEFTPHEYYGVPPTPHYAIDPYQARVLAILEVEIADMLSNEIQQSSLDAKDACHESVIKYIGQYEQDQKMISGRVSAQPLSDGSFIVGDSSFVASRKGTIVAGNPVFLLRLLRRLVDLLSNEACSKQIVIQKVVEIFEMAEMGIPTEHDLEEALEGLLRIHFVYGLNATDLRAGIFQHIHTNATLDLDDCLELTEKAIEMKASVLAYQWLTAAHLSIPTKELPLSKSTTQRFESYWNGLKKLARVKSVQELHAKMRNKRQLTMEPYVSFQTYSPCRGEDAASDNFLVCMYANHLWNPYFAINPVKAEILSYYPFIIQFYEFVGNKAIKHIQGIWSSGEAPLERAATVNEDEPQVNSWRTSMNTFVGDTDEFEPHPILKKLSGRVEKLLGLHLSRPGSSLGMQLAVYGCLGGHYDIHHDAYMETTPVEQTDHGFGNRIATFLIYLTNVRLGGYTSFPEANVAAKPVKGSAIFWFNLYKSGVVDDSTNHGGCPVILGQKQIANRWIMEYENMFTRPCGLNPYE